MRFAFASSLTGSLPVDAVFVVALAVAAAIFFYRRHRANLSPRQRAVLTTLRASALAVGLSLLLRPVSMSPPSSPIDVVVPVLVDVSRSMRIADADGISRIARAAAIARFDLAPVLSKKFTVPVLGVGDGVVELPSGAAMGAQATKSDLAGAVASVSNRFQGRRIAGIVLLSDGADTGRPNLPEHVGGERSIPVFAIGVGSASSLRDREITDITAGEPRLSDASIDVRVSASSVGLGRAPYEIRLMANGTVVDSRRVAPTADGSPVHATFTVVPDGSRDTVYTAEIPPAAGETVVENNSRSVLVSAPGRKRRLLVIAGAPGFEHSFMTREWSVDPALEVDSVIRKGKNAEGRDTFAIQAGGDRARSLAGGFPARREDLFAYDALVIANVEGTFFTHEQLANVASFVGDRGGGLLVTGSRSLAQGGLIGTSLEPVLPVELDHRRGATERASLGDVERSAPNQLTVTVEGAAHPIMRLGASGDDTRTRWAALPALAASTPLGQPRAGASVLAVVAAPDGGVSPVVAVQKYGRGRSMIFGGEASWRWRMLTESADRSHELFWRQTARWLSQSSPDQVTVSVPDALEPGDAVSLDIDARNGLFAEVPDATVAVSTSADGVETQQLSMHRTQKPGHFAAVFTPDHRGIYRVHVDASRGTATLGSADRAIYVGGGNREFADPRLNESFLRRLSDATGGRYVPAADPRRVLSWVDDSARHAVVPEQRDAWDRMWVFVVVLVLLCAEWTLRRRWGLR